MKIFWLIVIVVVGMSILKAAAHLEGWCEERRIAKDLRKKYPPNHPFWRS